MPSFVPSSSQVTYLSVILCARGLPTDIPRSFLCPLSLSIPLVLELSNRCSTIFHLNSIWRQKCPISSYSHSLVGIPRELAPHLGG
ncbi:hypothetical protein BO94DRAFT_603925 [Aspergillus sclerotioniger CBS 115572]|uniref:Uncharacterized protein n=1 Tax=Aspergillus sclerotioniger CBS 115572 TaxID=1450535 RepID=A0A317VWX4_9EURO|nr:hypothetical protein BO94DRAFT_603925 [Aspergillus sclerotioniger CBS 115572]PWY78089.1 hypothetical protein BO94DRAFT_603925 [Aspergillus sclerotioniger CBS 115572]